MGKTSLISRRTFIKRAILKQNPNLDFLISETVRIKMPEIIYFRVKALKKIGLHHNFYWPILQYITSDEEALNM